MGVLKMKITLAKALSIRKNLNSEIGNMMNKLYNASSIIEYEDTDDGLKLREQLMPEINVFDQMKQINRKREALRKLTSAIEFANNTTTCNETSMNITELWLLANDLRKERDTFQNLSGNKQKKISQGMRRTEFVGGNYQTVKDPNIIYEAPYDVSMANAKAKELTIELLKIDSLIQNINSSTFIEVDDDILSV